MWAMPAFIRAETFDWIPATVACITSNRAVISPSASRVAWSAASDATVRASAWRLFRSASMAPTRSCISPTLKDCVCVAIWVEAVATTAASVMYFKAMVARMEHDEYLDRKIGKTALF